MDIREKNCSVEGCVKPYRAKGYCVTHYSRVSRGLDPSAPVRPQIAKGAHPQCLITGCEEPYATRGACTKHARIIFTRGLDVLQLDMIMLTVPACETCGTSFETTPMHIDHDHGCCDTVPNCGNCIRGFLCGACNIAIGHLKNGAGTAFNVAVYLTKQDRLETR